MNDFRRRSKCLKTLIAASVAMGVSFTAYGQNLSVQSNQVSVTNGTPGFGPTTLEIQANGIVDTISNIPTTANFFFPNFDFALESSGGTAIDGTYTFDAGIVIGQDGSMRRLEILIPDVTMVFSNAGTTISGSVAGAGNTITVKGRSSDGSISATAMLPNNVSTFTGNRLVFDANKQIQAINAGGSPLSDLVNTFSAPGHYTYAVVLKQKTGSPTFLFGRNAATNFAAFGCAGTATDLFRIDSNALAATFADASGVQGQFSIAGATGSAAAAPVAFSGNCPGAVTAPATGGGGTGGGGTTTPVEEVTNIINTIPTIDTTTVVTEDTVTQLDNVAQNLTNLANSVSSTTPESTVTQILDAITSTTGVIGTTSTAAEGSATVSTQTTTDTLNSASALFTNLQSTTLSTNTVSTITTQTQNIFTNASTVITNQSGTAAAVQESVVNVVSAVSNVLNAAAGVSGGSVLTTYLVYTVASVSQTALSTTISGLAASVGSSDPVTTPAERTAALSANSSLLGQVINTAGIGIGSTSVDTTSATAALTGSGTSAANAAAIAANFAKNIDPTDITIPGKTAPTTVVLSGIPGSTGATRDATTGQLSVTTPEGTVSTSVSKIAIVSSEVPNGTTTLPDGSQATVTDGVATVIAPVVTDPVTLASAVTEAGLDVGFTPNGTVKVTDTTANSTFNGAPSFTPSNRVALGTGKTVFTPPPTSNPTSAENVWTVTFPDGSSQKLAPIIADTNIFDAIAALGLTISNDRTTGIMTIAGLRFRADFFSSPATAAEQAQITAALNTSTNGVVFNAVDANGDGIQDYSILSGSPSGTKQIVYGLP